MGNEMITFSLPTPQQETTRHHYPFCRFIDELLLDRKELASSRRAQPFDMDKTWSAISWQWPGVDNNSSHMSVKYHANGEGGPLTRSVGINHGDDMAKALVLAVHGLTPDFDGRLQVQVSLGMPSEVLRQATWPGKFRDVQYRA